MEDIAILTSGEVMDPELGMEFDQAGIEILGSCKKIIIGKDDTVIIDGAGEKTQISSRVEQINGEIENSTSDYDKEKLEERRAKL